MKLLRTCVTVGLFGVVALSREATCVTLPDLLFFHLLLQNELSQTRLNLHTHAHIQTIYSTSTDKHQSMTQTLRTQSMQSKIHHHLWFKDSISLTLLRCSSWSCFLFKASSSSSSRDRLLPSEPTGAVHKPKKLHKTQIYTLIKTHAHLSGGNHASHILV